MHSDTNSSQRTRAHAKVSGLGLGASLFAVLIFFVASGVVSYLTTKTLRTNAMLVAHTHEVIIRLNNVMSFIKDAETGQRGYVLTGDEKYLLPYKAALPQIEQQYEELQTLVADNPIQLNRLTSMRQHLDFKLDELEETVKLRRTKGFEAAADIIRSDRGKDAMDRIRQTAEGIQRDEQGLRLERLAESERAYRMAVLSGILAALFGIVLSVVIAVLLNRSARARARQQWLQSGLVGLNEKMVGDQRADKLGEHVLRFLADYCDAHAGALFIREEGEYRRVATYGVPEDAPIATHFKPGSGLLGQVARDAQVMQLNEVPDGYLQLGSALGSGNPRQLIIAPATADGVMHAVIELGFMHKMPSLTVELMQRIGEPVGLALRSAAYRAELQKLLEETQRQSEELQTQAEELKVNNEELEEQSNALKESQIRMEQQQAEMEQTNSQLEEQTQLLETQRDDLARARDEVMIKAQELEQASKYKSDFLANMSHELRTPLNSSLILAKLLADNPSGNLTDEQVKFAQTIQSSGNDLLALINDILDLSKIEAGHLEVRAENVQLSQLQKDLLRQFEPLAKQKGLSLAITIDKKCPKALYTDRLRLEQVLRNLLSNAIKFTEKGSVEIHAAAVGAERISFAVRDTGIGISAEHLNTVFNAFRQADSNINRKYGGTGLGLSISRELARLLGGHIELASKPGEGSTFTLTIPCSYKADNVPPKIAVAAPSIKPVTPIPFGSIERDEPRPATFPDDRETLSGDKRVILIVEDDESFARILYDLTRELDFQCLVANTAEDALVIARQYLPSAVVLDVGLPDHSGLSVLDRLKHDPRTRHIPVHVVSAGDYAQTALSLGAVGYMLKPVKREEIAVALKKMENKLSQRLRRVLIVEDDAVQRESLRKLLGTQDVETVAVGTANECMKQLKDTTFDCMVLDLSLPDASGYELLETLSREEAYAFPPVIVYTGRDLSGEDEHKLRRFSKSIIIKGAKSPERLLDEVTLFLHQVVSELPAQQQKMLEKARNRDAALEGRRVLVVEDDVRNIYALTSILEPHGTFVQIARNGREALDALEKSRESKDATIDLVLMDVMMPEMDGMTATRHIRKDPHWKRLPIIMLTAKAMRDDQEKCLDAGANDYMAKPLDVEKLLSLVRVWMPR